MPRHGDISISPILCSELTKRRAFAADVSMQHAFRGPISEVVINYVEIKRI